MINSNNNKEITLEDLAIMVADGFAQTATKSDIERLDKRMDGFDKRMDGFDKRMDGFDKRMDRLEGRVDHVDARLATIEQDVHELRQNAIPKLEFQDALVRIKYVEKKLGIESGK